VTKTTFPDKECGLARKTQEPDEAANTPKKIFADAYITLKTSAQQET
jgi:hypothetical protein